MSQDDEKTKRIRKEAREWLGFIHSGEADDEARARFEAWLSADPAHAEEYRRAEQIWRDLKGVETLAEVDRTRSLAARIHASAVRPYASALVAAVLLLVAAPISWFAYQSSRPEVSAYLTAVGNIEQIDLSDGSTITLGGRSRIETRFSRKERRVDLAAGEAFFSVEEDAGRPFIVIANDTEIRVTGTEFNVRRSSRDVRVAVGEGVVAVSLPGLGPVDDGVDQALTLAAGQEVTSSAGRLGEVETFDSRSVGAWREGRLVYNNAPLSDIIEDLRRYHDQPIVLNDENLKSLPITTSFRTDQIDQMLAVLKASHPIDIVEAPTGEIILTPRNSD